MRSSGRRVGRNGKFCILAQNGEPNSSRAVFTILGGVFSTMGGAQLIAWDAYGQPPVSNHAARAFLPSGIAFLSVGVVLAALGIPLIVANQTRVDISEHSVAAGRTGVELTPAGLVF